PTHIKQQHIITDARHRLRRVELSLIWPTLITPFVIFSNSSPTTKLSPLSLHDALPIYPDSPHPGILHVQQGRPARAQLLHHDPRSEEHTSELQSRGHLVCRLQLEKKKTRPLPVPTFDIINARVRSDAPIDFHGLLIIST